MLWGQSGTGLCSELSVGALDGRLTHPKSVTLRQHEESLYISFTYHMQSSILRQLLAHAITFRSCQHLSTPLLLISLHSHIVTHITLQGPNVQKRLSET